MFPSDLPAGVLDVGAVRLRWIGHQMRAEAEIAVDARATVARAHETTVRAEHELLHALPRLAGALVHADLYTGDGTDHHAGLAHHRGNTQAAADEPPPQAVSRPGPAA